MARKQTRKATKAEVGNNFDYIMDKMNFDIKREELAEVSVDENGTEKANKIEEETTDSNSSNVVNKDEEVSDKTNDKTSKEDSKKETNKKPKKQEDKNIPSPATDDEISEAELLAMIARRKKRRFPEKTDYTIPNADGSQPEKSNFKEIIEEKAKSKEEQEKESANAAKIPKVAKTFKIPEFLADDLDGIFKDSNGKRIAGTKGLLSIIVSNAVVEYLVSQGFKDDDYLSNLQEFKK